MGKQYNKVEKLRRRKRREKRKKVLAAEAGLRPARVRPRMIVRSVAARPKPAGS